jgi:hypothetical protein
VPDTGLRLHPGGSARQDCRVAGKPIHRSKAMAQSPARPAASPAAAKIDVRQIASDSGVAVEAYDTYDSDDETMAAAHRFAAGLLNRLAAICEAQPGVKTLDAPALRRIAAGLLPG